jgi:hypothetical protein
MLFQNSNSLPARDRDSRLLTESTSDRPLLSLGWFMDAFHAKLVAAASGSALTALTSPSFNLPFFSAFAHRFPQ